MHGKQTLLSRNTPLNGHLHTQILIVMCWQLLCSLKAEAQLAQQLRSCAEANVAWAAGVDDVDSYKELCHFIRTVSERSGVRHFVMHARKCLLAGLSPAQNRTIPPLRYTSSATCYRVQAMGWAEQLIACMSASGLPILLLLVACF